MRRTTARIAALLGLTALVAGCGTRDGDVSTVVQALRSGVFGGGEQDAGTGRPQFSRAAIEESGIDFILASVPQRSSLALVQRAGQNGSEVTWISEDGISVTYDAGVLVATRGLGPDLMASNVAQTVAALRQGGGQAVRVHEYLDGNDQIVRQQYSCRIVSRGSEAVTIYERSYPTVKYEETCERGSQRFTNTYWIDQMGVVWKSRQLISPPVGYLDSERL